MNGRKLPLINIDSTVLNINFGDQIYFFLNIWVVMVEGCAGQGMIYTQYVN